MTDTAFYCVADDRYFLGAVGLINSLRLVGHDEPIYLLDCGLTPAQRRLVSAQTILVTAPTQAPPTMLKTIAPLAHPAEVMVLIDTDMIVTRPLTEPITEARGGRVVAFADVVDRHLPQWGELLGLGPLRRHRYLSFGMLAIDRRKGTEVLQLLGELQQRIEFERTYWREGRLTSYPFLYADQDVLNAILGARVESDQLLALDERLAPLPPFAGVRIRDQRTLHCEGSGTDPYVLHHWLVKPWLEETHHGLYSRLLRRLLIEDDVAIRVPTDQIPLRLRGGLRAFAARNRVNARERLRYHVREPLLARRNGG